MTGIVLAAVAVATAVLLASPDGAAARARRLTRVGRGAREPDGRWGRRPTGRGRGRAGGGRDRSAGPLTVPTLLDLVAEVLASGAAPPRALAAVGECLERVGDPSAGPLLAFAGRLAAGPTRRPAGAASGGVLGTRPGPFPGAPSGGRAGTPTRADADRADAESGAVTALAAALDLAQATGAGPVTLIRAAAEDHRRRAHAEQVRAAHRLGVLVLLPTGLCLLPAFVLLTVVPLVIDLVVG